MFLDDTVIGLMDDVMMDDTADEMMGYTKKWGMGLLMIALENLKNGFWDKGLIHRGALADDGLFIISELTN